MTDLNCVNAIDGRVQSANGMLIKEILYMSYAPSSAEDFLLIYKLYELSRDRQDWYRSQIQQGQQI